MMSEHMPHTPTISKGDVSQQDTPEVKSAALAKKVLKELKKPAWNVPNGIWLNPSKSEKLVVGRCSNGPNSIVLHSSKLPSMLSRQHAMLLCAEGAWTVQDLGSLNGVYVNNMRLPVKQATPLKSGDVVCFGVNLNTNEFFYNFYYRSEGKAVLSREKNPEARSRLIVSISKRYFPPNYATNRSIENQSPSTRLTEQASNLHLTNHASALKNTPHTSVRNKKKTKKLDIDAIFGSQESENGRESVSKAIFGEDDSQPRSKLKPGMDAADILIQAAQEKMEKEKSHLLSNIEALKSELAAKEKLLVTKDESEKAAGNVLKENEDMLSSMQEEFTCVICQELFINAYTLPCAHTFCEWCIKEWMKSKKQKDCPICRKSITSEPVHSLVMDNTISKLVEKMSEEERKGRDEVKQSHTASLQALTASFAAAAAADEPTTSRGRACGGGTRARRSRGRGRGARRKATEVKVTIRHAEATQRAVTPPPPPPPVTIVISPPRNVSNPPIVISDEEDMSSDSSAVDSSSSSSETSHEGIPDAYYGGYGRCYNCGRRGHWAPGCPY